MAQRREGFARTTRRRFGFSDLSGRLVLDHRDSSGRSDYLPIREFGVGAMAVDYHRCIRSRRSQMTTVSAPVSRFLTVNGLQLHHLDWGNADAPALVCVHGLR